jgi:beta-lactam-binding protein with PASTA domain
LADGVVPDVRGLTTRNAVRELHRAGFRVQLTRGTTAIQQPAAGTLLKPGSVVRLAADR